MGLSLMAKGQAAKDTDVILLSAGHGSRLRPLTEKVPKPLVVFAGKKIIDWNLELIARSGFRRVFINLHYLGELIREHVGDGSKWGLSVEYSEETTLLDTGGGICQLQQCLQSDSFLVVNSDVSLLPTFNLDEVLLSHFSFSSDVIWTMMLRKDKNVESYGKIAVDRSERVCEFLGRQFFAAELVREYMYTGVQVLSSRVFDYMPKAGTVFSVTKDTLNAVLEAREHVHSYLYEGYWSDLGTIERLEGAESCFVDLLG